MLLVWHTSMLIVYKCAHVSTVHSTYLNATAIGSMFIHIAAQCVRIEAILECVQDIAAACTLRTRHNAEYGANEENNYHR